MSGRGRGAWKRALVSFGLGGHPSVADRPLPSLWVGMGLSAVVAVLIGGVFGLFEGAGSGVFFGVVMFGVFAGGDLTQRRKVRRRKRR